MRIVDKGLLARQWVVICDWAKMRRGSDGSVMLQLPHCYQIVTLERKEASGLWRSVGIVGHGPTNALVREDY